MGQTWAVGYSNPDRTYATLWCSPCSSLDDTMSKSTEDPDGRNHMGNLVQPTGVLHGSITGLFDGIDFPKPRLAGRQSKRNNVPADNAETYYKRAVWYPLLDCMLLELQHRFSSHSKAAMSMSALTPAKCTGCSFAVLADAVDIYGTFLSSGASACNAEYQRWQRKWEKVSAEECPTTAVDALKACNKAIYPNIAILLQIFATIPVTTATAERSFSSLRYVF